MPCIIYCTTHSGPPSKISKFWYREGGGD